MPCPFLNPFGAPLSALHCLLLLATCRHAPATPVRRNDVKTLDIAPSGTPPNSADLPSKSELRYILKYVASLRQKK